MCTIGLSLAPRTDRTVDLHTGIAEHQKIVDMPTA